MIFYFVWFVLRKTIEDLGWWFFFSCGLEVVFVAVDGRGGCDWCCGCFWDNGIYYFIVVILFYCDIYIILLC